MNKGVPFDAVGKKLFITNPAAMAFKHGADFEGFALSRATDRLVRVVLDANGKPTINAPIDANDPGNIVRFEVGVDTAVQHNSEPEGVVINNNDTRAYVMNLISRDVSVADVSGADPSKYKEIARRFRHCAALPTPMLPLGEHCSRQQIVRAVTVARTGLRASLISHRRPAQQTLRRAS